jgi:DNA helicase HerA-like ATPase
VEAYPTVGDPVLLPTQTQLRAIVESGENRRVKIGISPLAANAEVKIDPDRLFGRHLAVLGNTGSGKSCSVAGLIRWSMEEASQSTWRRRPQCPLHRARPQWRIRQGI